jgi:hypothetical protein
MIHLLLWEDRFETIFATPGKLIVLQYNNRTRISYVMAQNQNILTIIPSDPVVSLTSSITDGGDASNGNAFFCKK